MTHTHPIPKVLLDMVISKVAESMADEILDEEERLAWEDAYWDDLRVKLFDPGEQRFKDLLMTLFGAMGRDVLGRMVEKDIGPSFDLTPVWTLTEREDGRDIEKVSLEWVGNLADINFLLNSLEKADAPTKAEIESWMFSRKDWERIFSDRGGELIEGLAITAGERSMKEVPVVGVGFDIHNPEMQARLRDRSIKFAREVVGTTEEHVRSLLAEGMDAGEDMRQLRKRISDYFEGDPIPKRAEMIARTETLWASNAGTLEGYKQSGVVEAKEWLVARDERTCPHCVAMGKKFGEGQGIALDATFAKLGDTLTGYDPELEKNVTMTLKYEDVLHPPLHPRCFINHNVPIYTSQGWKSIRSVKVDDLVLTHRGRFRKVTEQIWTPGQIASVVKITVKAAGRIYPYSSVTGDHPVMANGAWKPAKHVQVGDKTSMLAGKCARCGTLTPYFNKYCSNRCCSLDITDRQWAKPEHRENIANKARAQMQREYSSGRRDPYAITEESHKANLILLEKGKHFFQSDEAKKITSERNRTDPKMIELRKFHSDRMKGPGNPTHDPEIRVRMTQTFLKTLQEHPEKHPNWIMGQKGFVSSLERKMAGVLDGLGVDYVRQYPIDRFFVDFAVVDRQIAIEADGRYWHKGAKEFARGYRRDQKIESLGWTVLHFGESRIKEDIGGVRDEIARVLSNHDGLYSFIDCEVVKVEYGVLRRPRMLYNFSVEEDESYIAKGQVVHNCRCTIVAKLKEFDVEVEGKRQGEPMGSVGGFSNCISPSGTREKGFVFKERPNPCVDYVRTDGKWYRGGAEEVTDQEELARLEKLRLPPGWRDVVAAVDPNSKVQAMGLDAAGRWQYRYSANHVGDAARAKFDRVKSFSRDMEGIRKRISSGMDGGDERAYLLSLEDKTAIRAGSNADTKAKQKAYGLTTLRGEHVTVDGNQIILDFTAKEGIPAHYELSDRRLARWLEERKTLVGDGPLFSSNAASVNKYLGEISGKEYTIKDFRTYHGTRIAYEELKDMSGKELTVKEKRKVVKEVSEKVSGFLKNTPTMARTSYIDPMVWDFIGGL